MMLKLKLQNFGYLMRSVDLLEDFDAGRVWGREEKGTTEDEMAGWHHWLDGHESEWTLGVGDGQGGLACYNSWGCKESDTTERLNWTVCEITKNQTWLSNWTTTALNILSRLVITFLPSRKRLLISWLQSPSAVILEPPKIKSHCFHCFPIYFPGNDGTTCHDLTFLNVEL